jgi:hypothetical protein
MRRGHISKTWFFIHAGGVIGPLIARAFLRFPIERCRSYEPY